MTHPRFAGVKVGHTRNVKSRLSIANIHCPENQFVMSHVSYFPNPRKAERRLHDLLKEHRLTGEWFDYPMKPLLILLRLVEEELDGVRKFNEV